MMRLNLKNKRISCLAIVLMLLSCQFVQAQQQNKFRYKADVAKVDSNGVYRIGLQPGFLAKSADKGLYDIRLIDDKGKFVACAIVADQPEKNKDVFVNFPEVKQTIPNDTATVYIADAGPYSNIDELWLRLKNTAVNRSANLSGSDDLRHWFAIKEDIELQGAGNSNDPEYEQMLSFPESKYRYFRVQINNKNKDPIRIIHSGVYVSSDRIPRINFIQLPAPKVEARDGNKQTSYFVNLDDNYQVDELELNITAPKYYSRPIRVYDISHGREQKLYDDSITSTGQKYFSISAKTNKMRIDILNGDDNPLEIKEVIPAQVKQFAVSYLEKGRQYYLFVGDNNANEVSYDLSFLHSKPMSQFPVIQHAAVYKNPAFAKPVFRVKSDRTPLIWAAIAAVVIILSLLTWRMVKEVNAKQGN